MKNIVSIFYLSLLFIGGVFFMQQIAYAYGECSEYGVMANYDSFTNSCKCMTGYVFQDNMFGGSSCVSADGVCSDKLGYGARYNSLYERCECRVGYVLGTDSIGRTQCITENESCQNQLGSHSRSTYGDQCECSYGYVISGGRCVDGDSLCYSKHGLHSEYDSLGNSCSCSNGYTLDDSGQCVEKQNNVYFTLKELDTTERRAIIRSDYDYRYYLINYNSGCYSSSFNRYLHHQIVVNLGTDFDLDTWDGIVLQDDNETCDVTHIERADSSTTLDPKEEETFYYAPPVPTPTPVPSSIEIPTIKRDQETPKNTIAPVFSKSKIEKISPKEQKPDPKVETVTSAVSSVVATSSVSIQKSTTTNILAPVEVKKEGLFRRIWKKFISWF